jgi:SAM-dependent methyltransferase
MLNRLLRHFGLQLQRVEDPPPVTFAADTAEQSEIRHILEAFTAAQPPGSPVGNLQEWLRYLSARRISFFHEVLDLLRQRGLSLDGREVADFGSGTGYLLRLIQQNARPAGLTGIDSFREANELARMFCPQARFVDSTDDVSRPLDVLFCTEVLEHLNHPACQLRQLAELLNAGGQLICTVPDGRSDSCPARQPRDDGSGYWGHIHFWSPESWPLFLAETLGPEADIDTGQLPCGKNFAIIRPPA